MFGHALAALDHRELDDELFYSGALLHDYGIVTPTVGRDFTLGGADHALACAEAAGVDRSRAELLDDGICVHATPGISVEADGALGCYLQWGAMADVGVLRLCDIAPGNVARALRRYPRGDFKRELISLIRAEAAAVPAGRMGLLVKCGFGLAVRLAPFES